MANVEKWICCLRAGTWFNSEPLNRHQRAVAIPLNSRSNSKRFASMSKRALVRLDMIFTKPNVSFLLLERRLASVLRINTGRILNNRIPLGSLIKPFVALGLWPSHQFLYPIHICMARPAAAGCLVDMARPEWPQRLPTHAIRTSAHSPRI